MPPEAVRFKRLVCSNCNIVEFVNTPVVKGWVCHLCLGGDTEIHRKLEQFSEDHGSPDMLVLKGTPCPPSLSLSAPKEN